MVLLSRQQGTVLLLTAAQHAGVGSATPGHLPHTKMGGCVPRHWLRGQGCDQETRGMGTGKKEGAGRAKWDMASSAEWGWERPPSA